MFGLGPFEIVVIGAIAVMLYGKRLPEVGRTFGKTLGDLRRQWQTLSRELEVTAHLDDRLPTRPARSAGRHDDESGPVVTAPRFDPPTE
ncbi:MAG: twin-arginine translocase TatA/TatE family subunit [Planctomycetota bacterium]|nr:MAG: twin-arginine translocase TatA/TatE family subunit [Planctomycetota bacterium]